ncbi:MAG: FAD-dependent oxidoreductase [Gammaproteobacteria bacterium]|nr:FAD-dependent oxidoreductase [Gammaproteobacteria bacterium]
MPVSRVNSIIRYSIERIQFLVNEANMSTQTDVIIVGAGAAGLSAAKELTRQGISFVVLEASHRIGGRAYSEEIAPDTWFDLGCAYLDVGPDPENRVDESNPFVDFAVKQGAVVEEYLYDSHYIRNGGPLNESEMKARERYYDECEEAIRRSVEAGDDCAISELVDLESPYATPYIDMMAVTAPKDLDEASAADFFHRVEEHKTFNTLRGYGNLVAQWGNDVAVSLNSKVESVDWSGKDVVVKTIKGSIRTRCLISTVSNGILAAQHIHFKPRLPDWKMEAIQGVPMGAENKIGVHFTKDIFAPEASGYYQVWSDEAQGAFIDVNLMSTNVVTVFIGGRFSIWMEQQDQQAAREFAVDRIADIFGNDIRQSVGRSIVTAWVTDPWTLGSYASALPGQYRQREALPLGIDNKLFFAGEATARFCGFCHGAYWSGVRAAREVSAVLG